VLVVSAHYPPNFVSGGSLQPHKLARRLRERGHDVRVYAGWVGEREPLETFTSEHEGVPIRWIVSTPFMSWNDDRNWDNPVVAADFESYLDELAPGSEPELVHVHSLQMLGAGLITAAKRRGIPVVVTMHDFWWVCPRVFLVDRTMRPCCLVVTAGDCQCEAGRSWLETRDARLRTILADVDLVLTPSESAARVAAANGVDPHRLEVDENGLEHVPGVAEHEHGGSVVRFLYLGGSNPMKGAGVLADALGHLSHLPRWELVAYGLDAKDGLHTAGSSLDSRPAFEPGSEDKVYGQGDVLLVPSLMRESYSLVTREALLRGLPVICTDTLGPEEVVRDGVNGFVVPAGSADALAGAMRKVVTSPGLLDHLRSNAPAIAVRSLDEQVEGLEARYAAVVDHSRSTRQPSSSSGKPSGRRRVRHVLFVAGIDGAPLRYRAHLPREALGLLGVSSELRWYRDPDLVPQAVRADAVVLYRVPATPHILDLVGQLRLDGKPTFFDVDDLIFEPELASEIPALSLLPRDEADLWLEGVRRYRTTMAACDAFIGSTDALVEHAERSLGMPAHRFDNGVGILNGQAADIALGRSRTRGQLRIGYFSGTNTHDRDWRYVEPAIAAVLDRHPGVELWLGGSVPRTGDLSRFASRLRRFSLMPWQDLQDVLRDVDVNLAPLEPGMGFNEAKSAIKWLEAALVETPTVASPTGPFCEAIDDGRTGLLAEDLEQWADRVSALLGDDELRAAMGRRARREALLRWSPHLQARRYLEILSTGPADGRSGRAGGEAVSREEPPESAPHRFEPYQLQVPVSWALRRRATVLTATTERTRARVQPWIDRAGVLVREQGVGGVLRGAGRQLKKRLGRA
jgi:glycosyltransferase involved in cell wall biosynthesis